MTQKQKQNNNKSNQSTEITPMRTNDQSTHIMVENDDSKIDSMNLIKNHNYKTLNKDLSVNIFEFRIC